MIKEKDIIHESGRFWVLKKAGVYYVMVSMGTHSISDSCYATADLAIARCNYMGRKS